MKRAWVSLIMASILIFLTACNSNNDINTLKHGTYVLEATEAKAAVLPSVKITDDNISFSYDVLSSYLPIGTYTIKNDILTMITDDGRYRYVFKVNGDKLIFQENGSSEVKLTDDRIGIKITDNAEFKLKEN